VTDRVGAFSTIVVKMIKMLKEKGYRVQTNHDGLPRDHPARSSRDMVKYLTSLGVDGMLLSPGYHYQVLQNDDEYLRQRRDAGEVFSKFANMANDYKIINTPIYLDYLGPEKRDMQCSPWDDSHAKSARMEGGRAT